MNQTGTLGTYLAGSLIYVGGAGDVNVIPAGTVGVQNTVISEDMIANKDLYCSGVYKGIRAVGRVATEVTTGIAVPDVCESIDEIVEEDTEGKSSET